MLRNRRLLRPAWLASGLLTGACLLVGACGSEPGSPAAAVPVEVAEVALDLQGNPVILLKERDGERTLPIWIGLAEARSIASRLKRIETPRPNTHDLAQRLLEGLDASVERVVVTELRRNTYYGLIVMRGPDGRVQVDSRPSDAIALALRVDAPIFVAEALFSDEPVVEPDAAVEPEPADRDEREEPRPDRLAI